jgi:3-oxo-5-alpha-steroid 4-dehydrogenase 1
MNEKTLFNYLILAGFVLAAMVFVALFFVVAPYGRHLRRGWGPALSDRTGWIIMEFMAPVGFILCFIFGQYKSSITGLVFLAMWELHYMHRAFIFPFTLRNTNNRMSLVVISLGLLFNVAMSYLNGRYIFNFSGGYDNRWLITPQFIIGAAFFIGGYVINRQSDLILRGLRQPGESGYKVPYGGLYRWISCPNYFGEIVQWTGWAIATWSLPGVVFAVWTAANLAPRARSHQHWYKEYFPRYPSERKALVPGIW